MKLCNGKVRFASWDEAGLALVDRKIKRALRGRAKCMEQEIKYCGLCHGFHLTIHQSKGQTS